jgi:ketosteroid isomerase-like protein
MVKVNKGENMNNKLLIEKLYQGFRERDIPALSKICHPEIVWTQNPGFPGGRVSIGIAEIITNVYEANTNRWKYFQFSRESIISGEDTVLVQGSYIVTGKNHERSVSAQTAHVFKIEDNKVISFQQYTDSKTLWDNYKI